MGPPFRGASVGPGWLPFAEERPPGGIFCLPSLPRSVPSMAVLTAQGLAPLSYQVRSCHRAQIREVLTERRNVSPALVSPSGFPRPAETGKGGLPVRTRLLAALALPLVLLLPRL